jgi:hypothetical protein
VPTTFGIREATIEQDNIGWYNFLLGRLSSRWADSQQRYLESIKKCNSGRRWTIAILDKIWDILWDMWEHRNGIVHDPNHPRRQAMQQMLQMEVQEVYEEGSDTLLSRDRLLFSKPLDTLQPGSEIEMRQWLSSVLLARQRAVSQTEEYVASLHAERNAMRQWLQS